MSYLKPADDERLTNNRPFVTNTAFRQNLEPDLNSIGTAAETVQSSVGSHGALRTNTPLRDRHLASGGETRLGQACWCYETGMATKTHPHITDTNKSGFACRQQADETRMSATAAVFKTSACTSDRA